MSARRTSSTTRYRGIARVVAGETVKVFRAEHDAEYRRDAERHDLPALRKAVERWIDQYQEATGFDPVRPVVTLSIEATTVTTIVLTSAVPLFVAEWYPLADQLETEENPA